MEGEHAGAAWGLCPGFGGRTGVSVQGMRAVCSSGQPRHVQASCSRAAGQCCPYGGFLSLNLKRHSLTA